MKRQDRIYNYVMETTQPMLERELLNGAALTTKQIADVLELARPNVSKELNELVREERLTKINGRPVRYSRPIDIVENATTTKIKTAPRRQRLRSGMEPISEAETSSATLNIFDQMIGSAKSMRNQVEQAKAALLYPPRGLNTLIIGPTGSGKTYFANAMFQFAQKKELMTEAEQLVTFNCADYAHNPELLMSHLFGYTKGAFTGADDEQDGLIQEADGGMLFLDEVHRLPPEGQEMIFYFMDHGTYSRLGETAKTHHANVRLICATTEDPESSLLQTFVRRIPITIQLPSFNKRSPEERIELLKSLLELEANRTNKQITLTEDVVQALLGSVTYGNVGQLKSNIQLVCARGFLNSMENETEITISADDLPPNIKDGLFHLASNREDLGAISKLLQPYMVIKPNSKNISYNQNDTYELPYNLYEIIDDKAAMLREEGLDQEHINNFITTDINLHLKTFNKDTDAITNSETKLAEIVDQDIIDFTKEVQSKIEQRVDYKFNDNFIYAMSLHISSFVKRIQSGKPMRLMGKDMVAMVKNYPEELAAAREIKRELEERYQMPIPESESYYLAILQISLRMAPTDGKVGIVVAAHGGSTASSMVQVVAKLLSDNTLQSFDMPLEMDPTDAYSGIVDRVKEVDQGKGVLLMVDMGSLSTFGTKITEDTGIPVKTIDMVTTAMVLEAARKVAFIDSDLDGIYTELREFHGYSRLNVEQPAAIKNPQPTNQLGKPKAIVAICSTGEGTAKRIKNMLDQLLVQNLVDDVKVIPISVVNMNKHLHQIEQEYQILATTGIIDPKLNAPFMTLQDLLQGGGDQLIRQVMNTSSIGLADAKGEELHLTKDICRQYLSDYFVFINPDKFTDILWNYVDYLSEISQNNFGETFRISLIMHLAGAVERYLNNDPIEATATELAEMMDSDWLPLIQETNAKFLENMQIKLNRSEEYYILRLVETWQAKNDTITSDLSI